MPLVEGTLRLAAKLALRFSGRGVPIDELIEEANLALVEAAAKFEPARATRFATFATHRIDGRLRNLVGRDRPIQSVGEPEDYGTEPSEPASDTSEELAAVTAGLTDRQRGVLLARVGYGETYQVVADRFGLSIEGVRQVEAQAMADARRLAAERAK